MAIYKAVESLELVCYESDSEEFNRGVNYVLERLDELPVAKVEEVRHGEWLGARNTNSIYNDWYCSVCEQYENHTTDRNRLGNYCPNCGAKMDGGEKE